MCRGPVCASLRNFTYILKDVVGIGIKTIQKAKFSERITHFSLLSLARNLSIIPQLGAGTETHNTNFTTSGKIKS